ncbi:MAG: regulatory protein MarR [Mucilaginibacter sp.]|nr:regulatory protein MarR [Mucilaginibacter sp.]
MNSAGSLSMSEIDTLSFLYNSPSLSPSELAELIKIKGQSMSEVITRLETNKIVSKKKSQTDKRKFEVALTDQGRLLVEQTRYERDEWLSTAISTLLTEEEKNTLATAANILDKLSAFQ